MSSRLRALVQSVSRLVEGFPIDDAVGVGAGLGSRLLRAVGSIPTALARSEASRTSAERKRHLAAAHGCVAEAGYLISQSRRMSYGWPEHRHSAARRLTSLSRALRPPRERRS